jgi:anionic cell wall polymer biosynthesis LytR-Cps2A-Psr (LCP) family protein
MVDAVGGVTLNVRDRIPIGGIGAPVTGYIKPGKRKLNGFQTLWFARSRVAADDYSRMARQKCVMNAMLQQLSPAKVVMKFENIAKASEDLISTDVPLSEVDRFIALALKARSQPVRTVSFVPPLVSTGHPDIAKIQATVQAALKPRKAAKAVSATKGAKTATQPSGAPRQPASQGTTGGAIGSMNAGYAANQADDLGSAC